MKHYRWVCAIVFFWVQIDCENHNVVDLSSSVNGAFLVIGPKSTLSNWRNEVNRFCPTLRSLVLIGDKTARSEVIEKMNDRKSWDVCLTTYEMILSEKSALKRFHWRYLVVDEAHRLKNENSKLSSILRTFQTDNRLLLTGTPLQVYIEHWKRSYCK